MDFPRGKGETGPPKTQKTHRRQRGFGAISTQELSDLRIELQSLDAKDLTSKSSNHYPSYDCSSPPETVVDPDPSMDYGCHASHMPDPRCSLTESTNGTMEKKDIDETSGATLSEAPAPPIPPKNPRRAVLQVKREISGENTDEFAGELSEFPAPRVYPTQEIQTATERLVALALTDENEGGSENGD